MPEDTFKPWENDDYSIVTSLPDPDAVDAPYATLKKVEGDIFEIAASYNPDESIDGEYVEVPENDGLYVLSFYNAQNDENRCLVFHVRSQVMENLAALIDGNGLITNVVQFQNGREYNLNFKADFPYKRKCAFEFLRPFHNKYIMSLINKTIEAVDNNNQELWEELDFLISEYPYIVNAVDSSGRYCNGSDKYLIFNFQGSEPEKNCIDKFDLHWGGFELETAGRLDKLRRALRVFMETCHTDSTNPRFVVSDILNNKAVSRIAAHVIPQWIDLCNRNETLFHYSDVEMSSLIDRLSVNNGRLRIEHPFDIRILGKSIIKEKL